MANIKIDIDVVTRGAQASLQKVSVQADKADKSFKGLTKSTSALSQAAKIAGVAIAGYAFGTLIKGAIDSASRLEDLNTKFTTLTGSAQKATDLFEELAKFSTVTPFELNEIAEAGGKLLAFGFASTEVKDRLSEIGDVAASVDTDLNQLALIFGQVGAEGKLTGERLRQFEERGVAIGPALVKSLNEINPKLNATSGNLRKLVSAGVVTFDIFDKAFKSLSQEGGPAFEGMITRSKTLSGLISTLKGNFDLFLGTLGQKVLPAVKATVLAFTSLIDIIKNNQTAIVGALGGLAVAVGILTAKFIVMKVQAALAWAAAAAPATLVIVAIAAVGAGIALLIKHWDEVKLKATEFYAAAISGAINTASALGLPTAALEKHRASLQRSIDTQKLQIEIDAKQKELEKTQAEERKRLDKEKAQREREAKVRQEEDSRARIERMAIEAAEEKKYIEEKLAAESKLNDELTVLFDELKLQKEANRLVETEQEVLFADQRLIAMEEFFTRSEEAEIQAGINRAGNEAIAQKLILKAQVEGQKRRRKKLVEQTAWEKMTEEEKTQFKLNSSSRLFKGLASISALGGKKMFQITKALRLAEATTSGIAAVNAALAAPPGWPFNAANVIGTGLMQAANVAKIASTSAPNFEQGGIVPGASFSGDNVAANVNSGEMILNREQQNNLFSIAQGGGGGGSTTNITVELDGEVVGRAVSRQVRDGLELGEVS